MSERALRAALRARAQVVERGRMDLAAAIAVADGAAQAERQATAAISEEADIATSLESGDIAVEAFSAWLPAGRRAVATARARREEAETCVVVARAALAAARSAEAATEALLARHKQERQVQAGRTAQRLLDEAAARRQRPADPPPEPGSHLVATADRDN